MSNINFEAALRYIDLGSYDKAIEKLNQAINEEFMNDNEMLSVEYRCVLGELYAQLGKFDEARDQFSQVIFYSDENHVLGPQRNIADTYIKAFDGNLPMTSPENADAKRPGDIPLVPKPVQNKGFISRQLNKKHR